MNKIINSVVFPSKLSKKLKIPRSLGLSQGFTLMELLVTVAIIAIISVIGVAAYRGFSSKANDPRRQADLKAIATVLESKKVLFYPTLSDSLFASGKIPTDPVSTKAYCISYTTSSTISFGSKPDPWVGVGCPGVAVGKGVNDQAFNVVASGQPVGSVTAWMLCALMDDNSVQCRNSGQ